MLGYLSTDIICSEKRTIFRERSSRKTVSYEEQIMSKDKHQSLVYTTGLRCIMVGGLKVFGNRALTLTFERKPHQPIYFLKA